MSIYLYHLVQTPATLAKLIAAPEDRRQTIEPIFKGMGGSVLGFWYGVGGSDVYVVAELPDDVASTSLTTRVTSSGRILVGDHHEAAHRRGDAHRARRIGRHRRLPRPGRARLRGNSGAGASAQAGRAVGKRSGYRHRPTVHPGFRAGPARGSPSRRHRRCDPCGSLRSHPCSAGAEPPASAQRCYAPAGAGAAARRLARAPVTVTVTFRPLTHVISQSRPAVRSPGWRSRTTCWTGGSGSSTTPASTPRNPVVAEAGVGVPRPAR